VGGDIKTIFQVNLNLVEFLKSLSALKIAQKTHEQFVKEYLRDTLFFYNASDATKIPLREKPVKVEKEKFKPKRRGRPKKGETREPKHPVSCSNKKI
jgi:hypothetical protein